MRKVLVYISRLDFYLILARHAVKKKQWRLAKKYYHQALKKGRLEGNYGIEVKNEAKINISIANRLINQKATQEKITNYKKNKTKPKIAVYTAIAGDYDTLKLPEKLNKDIDYILFTDKPTKGYGVFDVRPIPFFHEDPTRQARFVKTHPHQLLAGYDIAIWVDANLMLLGDISRVIEKFKKSGKAVGAIPHPLRDSIYEEGEECIARGKDNNGAIEEQLAHYREINFDCSDLIESNLMMFSLRDPKISSFFNDWWSEIDKYSRRDQLSLNYTLNKNNIKWHKLMRRPYNSRNHPLLAIAPHKIEDIAILELENRFGLKAENPLNKKSFKSIKSRVVQAQQKKKVDVVYCVHNALDDVKICLNSVVKHRKNKNLNLIIVDDGSNKPTRKYLEEFKDNHSSWVKLLQNQVAGGYTKAANKGVLASKGELVILLNSDTIVTDSWIEKMADAVFSTPGAGIVGPLSSAASHQSIPDFLSKDNQTAINELPPSITPEDMNRCCEEWSVAGFYPRVPLIHGFCFGITREAINKVGQFDEKNFPSGYGEENDYCFRATDAGFSLVIATNTYIYHTKSKSYQTKKRVSLMRQGNQRLRDLHGKERIRRAIITMQEHPTLSDLRQKARNFYKTV